MRHNRAAKRIGAEALEPRMVLSGLTSFGFTGELVGLDAPGRSAPTVVKPYGTAFGSELPEEFKAGGLIAGATVGGGLIAFAAPEGGRSSVLFENQDDRGRPRSIKGSFDQSFAFARVWPASASGTRPNDPIAMDGATFSYKVTITDESEPGTSDVPERSGSVEFQAELMGLLGRSKVGLTARPIGETSKVAIVNGAPVLVHFEGLQAPTLVPGQGDGRASAYFPGALTASVKAIDPDYVSISATDPRPTESSGTVEFLAKRTGSSPGTVTVAYELSGGPAGDDFQATGGTIVFGPGELEKSVKVIVQNDDRHEGDESHSLQLLDPRGGLMLLGPSSSAPFALVDDDPRPVVSIEKGQANEGQDVSFAVRLSSPSSSPVTVDYASDLGNGSLTFLPGEREQVARVSTQNDDAHQADRAFGLRLTRADGADLGVSEATGTIVDDDPGTAAPPPPPLEPARPPQVEGPIVPPAIGPGPVSPLVVTTTDDGGPGSLRSAIENANARPGPDVVSFDLKGEGPFVIKVASALPKIVDPLTIDGTTQMGPSSSGPLVELDGSGAPEGTDGLVVTSGRSTIRAMAIGGFSGHGVRLTGTGGNALEGNYIGTDATGTIDRGNLLGGVLIDQSARNRVGGMAPGQGNLISGNGGSGIDVQGGRSANNKVMGNAIGPDVSGGVALGNSGPGVALRLKATNNVVTGNQLAGNVGPDLLFSGRAFDGRSLDQANFAANRRSGNLIGTNKDGTDRISGERPDVKVELPRPVHEREAVPRPRRPRS